MKGRQVAAFSFHCNRPGVGAVIGENTTVMSTHTFKESPSLTGDTSTIIVEGMTCASCVRHVEKALSKVPGVSSASVNLATNKATVQHTSTTSLDALYEAIDKAGYTPVSESNLGSVEVRKDGNPFKKPLLVAAVFSVPIFLLEMIPMLIPGMHHWLHSMIEPKNLQMLVFLLSTAVQFGPARIFYSTGLKGLLHGSPNMNTLVMLGTSAAYGYSVATLFFPDMLPSNGGHGYFEAASVVITLVLLGKHLEHVAKKRTTEAVKKLAQLQPTTASVIIDGEEIDVPVQSIKKGSHVKIRPGDRVPLDGIIIGGLSYVDESMITGESLPVEKTVGNAVIGGTLNRTGSFTFEVTHSGTETMLSKIIRMVEDAQGSRPAIQALADKVVSVFVPIVLGLALLTLIAWLVFGSSSATSFAVASAVAVLIIACPCAMGLATPTSIMVATGRGAEIGTLFRNPQALETLAEIDVFAFDKTGTLTSGKPQLTDLVVTPGITETEALSIIGGIESHSNHPVAEAVTHAIREEGIEIPEVDDFSEQTGRGIQGIIGNELFKIGSGRWMRELGFDLTEFENTITALSQSGKTPAFLANSESILAIFAVSDAVKESAAIAVERLIREGKEVVMISGDDERVARTIGHALGIGYVIAEVLPQDKAGIVKDFQGQGKKVAFIGDGINDAPALAQADVGIAMGTGTDVAIETGDVVLMNGDVTSVSRASNLSRITIRNIKQNLFWAFAYNVILIPVAAGVLYPAFGITLSPVLAAAAMGISSIFVLGNSLRLKTVSLA
jgi:P-type Cu+ transporter